MAAYTSKAAGNWSASGQTTWNEVGVPGNGDTVTITHAVAVDVNTTVGHSPAADDATAAILVSGSGSLTVNSGVVLTVRGDITLANTVLTLAAGSTVTFDSTAAGTPSTAFYKLRLGSTTGQTSSKLVCNGTANSRVTINKAGGSANGLIGRGINNSSCWSQIRATYTDFLDFGKTSTGYGADAIEINLTTGQEGYLDHCVFTRCGRVMYFAVAATGDVVFTFNQFSAGIEATGYLVWFATTVATTGLRTVTDNLLLDGDTNKSAVFAGNLVNFTIERNYGAKWITSALSGIVGAATAIADNIFVPRAGASSVFTNLANPGGTMARTYWCSEANAEIGGLAPSITGALTFTLDGLIGETSWAQEDMDLFHAPSPVSAQTYNLRRVLVLPNSRGRASGNITHHADKYYTLSAEHCTLMSNQASPSSTGQAAVYLGSGYLGHAGMIASLKSNLIWGKATPAADGYIAWSANYRNSGTADSGTTTSLVDAGVSPAWRTTSNEKPEDAGAKVVITSKSGSGPEVGEEATITASTATSITFSPAMTAAPDTGTGYQVVYPNLITAADYNAAYNLRSGTCYDDDGLNAATKAHYHQLSWTNRSAIGANDITLTAGTDESTEGPQFVDSTRNLATFDTAKLGNTATAWADATAYAVGDLVSAATATFYGNATINYRCVTAHTSAAGHATNGKPGSAASYRANWEFASAYRLRQGILNGTTLDGYNYVRGFYEWVLAGFAFRNAALHNTAHDGGDIGAGAYEAPPPPPGGAWRSAVRSGVAVGL